MSISYKKINSLIDQVLDEEMPNEEFRALSNEQKLTLRKLCKEVYMLESSPGNEFSSSQILSDIKGKINLSSDKIVGG